MKVIEDNMIAEFVLIIRTADNDIARNVINEVKVCNGGTIDNIVGFND